jgi:hypothetical protein
MIWRISIHEASFHNLNILSVTPMFEIETALDMLRDSGCASEEQIMFSRSPNKDERNVEVKRIDLDKKLR